MNTHKVAALGLMSLVSGLACADASYEQTSQITGGTLTDTIRSFSFLGKATQEMLAPTNSLTMVHGNQKAVVSKNSTEIIDLDKETITRFDTEKKTYTVMTFAQMRQAAADMMKRIQQAPPQQTAAGQQAAAGQQPKPDLKTSFEVSVKNTGQSKSVNGLNAQEQVVELHMHITDPNGAGTAAQNTITYTVTTDAWIAPDPPEVKEIQDFDARMGKKMMEGADLSAFAKFGGANAGMAQMFGSKPGTAEAMAQMQKEMAKLKGTRVMEMVRMGGDAPATATGQPQSAGSGSSVVGDATQAAGSAATNSAAGATGSAAGSAAANAAGNSIGSSVLGSAASAFGSKLVSGMFQKKPAAAASPTNTATTTVAGTQPTTNLVLMEMTMQKSNFSREAIPPSAFAVPEGFKQLPSPYDQMSKHSQQR
ncbi:MAG: hypothetical protein ACYDBZ_00025 [Steroidobacteraceae bacterium]